MPIFYGTLGLYGRCIAGSDLLGSIVAREHSSKVNDSSYFVN